MNFIDKHLIKKIKKIIENKQDYLNYVGFFYFNVPINREKYKIDRINSLYAYTDKSGLLFALYTLNGNELLEIYTKLKNNEFFVYKKIDGKEHKIWIKNDKK